MKMRQVLLICFIFMISSCHPDKFYKSFSIQNNSSDIIAYSYADTYPDTTLKGLGFVTPGTVVPGVPIDPGTTYTLYGGKLPEYFKPSGVLQIFIFDYKTVSTTTWDTIVSKNLFLKRFQVVGSPKVRQLGIRENL